MIPFYFIYLAILTVITLLLYGSDKLRAIRGAWRIPEKVLLGAGLLGGAIGALLGMQLFRHKTKHWYFTVINTAALLLHAALLLWLLANV